MDILYITYYNKDLEIILLADSYIASYYSFSSRINAYRVLQFFRNFFNYIRKIQVLKLVFKKKYF